MARATFYYHLKQLRIPDKYADIRTQISDIYHLNKGRYGYRRITMTLHNMGIIINHKTVRRLMRESGIRCELRLKKYRSYRGLLGKIAPNVLERNFEANKPNTKWATDVTEFSICGQKRYLSPIIDLYNREIVCYSISKSATLLMVTNMLEKSFRRVYKKNKLILHSDQGYQYQNSVYQQMLKNKGIIQSMSRKGNCLDNSVIENFFGLLKSEFLYSQKFKSIAEFDRELKKYIHYYNNDRIKVRLKGMSPVQYRIHNLEELQRKAV